MGYAECMKDIRNSYEALDAKIKGRYHFENLSVGGKFVFIKIVFKSTRH
jgi:hypothetical protein